MTNKLPGRLTLPQACDGGQANPNAPNLKHDLKSIVWPPARRGIGPTPRRDFCIWVIVIYLFFGICYLALSMTSHVSHFKSEGRKLKSFFLDKTCRPSASGSAER